MGWGWCSGITKLCGNLAISRRDVSFRSWGCLAGRETACGMSHDGIGPQTRVSLNSPAWGLPASAMGNRLRVGSWGPRNQASLVQSFASSSFSFIYLIQLLCFCFILLKSSSILLFPFCSFIQSAKNSYHVSMICLVLSKSWGSSLNQTGNPGPHGADIQCRRQMTDQYQKNFKVINVLKKI